MPTKSHKPNRDFVPLLNWLDEVPPFFARAIAVEKGSGKKTRRVPVRQLVEWSGIKTRRFKYLCNMISWDEVTVGDMSRFLLACNVDVIKREKMNNTMRLLTKKKLAHLTLMQRTKFDRLALKWKKWRENSD